MHVLVAASDHGLASRALRRSGMMVDVAANGVIALALSNATAYDVIIIDHDLAGVHGDVMRRQLRGRGTRSPILMLTGARTSADKAAEDPIGADRYLAKPFELDELVSRVRELAEA